MTTTTHRSTARLDQSTVHSLLSDEYRRAAIAAVDEADRPVSADALATMLAARDRALTPPEVTADERAELSRELRREHLPLLADNAVIASVPGGYAPGPNFDALREIVDASREHLAPP